MARLHFPFKDFSHLIHLPGKFSKVIYHASQQEGTDLHANLQGPSLEVIFGPGMHVCKNLTF